MFGLPAKLLDLVQRCNSAARSLLGRRALLVENRTRLAGCAGIEQHDLALQGANRRGSHAQRCDSYPLGAELKTVQAAKGSGILILLTDRSAHALGFDLVG